MESIKISYAHIQFYPWKGETQDGVGMKCGVRGEWGSCLVGETVKWVWPKYIKYMYGTLKTVIIRVQEEEILRARGGKQLQWNGVLGTFNRVAAHRTHSDSDRIHRTCTKSNRSSSLEREEVIRSHLCSSVAAGSWWVPGEGTSVLLRVWDRRGYPCSSEWQIALHG